MKPAQRKSPLSWIRLWTDVVGDPKIQRLPDRLFKALINLWCLGGKSGDGTLPGADDIAWALRLPSAADAEALVEELVKLKLLDRESGVARPHNWDVRQAPSDSSTTRVRQHRERRRAEKETQAVTTSETRHETLPVTFHETPAREGGNVTETATVTDRERAEQKEEKEKKALPSGEGKSAPPSGSPAEDGWREDGVLPLGIEPDRPDTAKGTRLPADWSLSKRDIEYALSKGLRLPAIHAEAEAFVTYWTNKPGKAGLALNWSRSWMTWIQREVKRNPPPPKSDGADWESRIFFWNETGSWPLVWGAKEIPAEYEHLMTRPHEEFRITRPGQVARPDLRGED